MRVSLLFCFSLCFAPATLAQAPVPGGKIARITFVHGSAGPFSPSAADRVSDDAIRAVMMEKVGDTYDPAGDQKDQRAISKMGLFQRVGSAVSADPAAGVDIIYSVVEAPLIRKIILRANTSDSRPPVPAETLLALMSTKQGQRLNIRTLRQDVNRMANPQTGYLHQQGYDMIGSGNQFGFDSHTGTLTIRLILARIAQITVTGNQKVKTDDIIRRMHSQAGDLINLNTLQEDIVRLQKTGLFQSVGPYAVDARDPQILVTVPVVERPNLKVAADPVLTPMPGEIRLEGTLRDTSPAQKRLVLLALRAQPSGRPAQVFDAPRPQVVLLGPATQLRSADGGRSTVSAFQPGDAVIVIGRRVGANSPLSARIIAAQ